MVLSRSVSLIAVLLVTSAIVFMGGRAFVPGDLSEVIAGAEGATPAQLNAIRQRYGLDKPLLVQYGDWLKNALQGNLGVSAISQRPVAGEIASEASVSLEVTVAALLIATLVGVPAGLFAATHANRGADIVVRTMLLITFSLPIFVLGIVMLFVASQYVPFLYAVNFIPLSQSVSGNFRSISLPALSIGIPTAAMTMQLTRTALLEALAEPHIEMARARGLSETRVRYIHALKNALPPIVTMQGFQFGVLLGGLFVVEEIFSLPGLGRGILLAISQRDFQLLTAQTMVIAASFIVANFIVDLLYPVLDPRQRT